MPSRLIQLSSDLDRILKFDYGDDDEDKKKNSLLGTAAKTGGVVGAGAAGLYGVGAMSKSGLAMTGRQAVSEAGSNLSKIGQGGGKDIAATIGIGAKSAAGTLGDKIASMGALKTGNAIAGAPRVANKLIGRAAPVLDAGTSAISSLYAKLRGLATRLSEKPDGTIEFKSPIEIKKKNRGKFDAAKKKTGESTEELEDSKNPKTRERAVFAENAKHWNHKGRRKSRAGALSSILDDLIELEEAPKTDSWNPIRRHRQHKELKDWVANRSPGAGVTTESLEKKYPTQGRGRRITGEVTGAILGSGAASLAHVKLTGRPSQIAGIAGAVLGGAAGNFVAGPKHAIADFKQDRTDMKHLKKVFKEDRVPASGLRAAAPIATSYRQVAGELKKQDVGFLKRHATAAATFPIRHMPNAAFIPQGNKGVIVSNKNVPEVVIKHESGHAKDYAHYGGHRGFKTAYPHYGNPFVRGKTYIANTLLPEERAWKNARVTSRKDRQTKDAALGTYKRAGFFNALLDDILAFKAIDLGRTYENYASPGDSPSPEKKSYPSLYIGDRDEELKLPMEGKAIVRYKLRRKSMNQDETGKKKHSADIEIHDIDPIKEDQKPKEGGRAKLLGLTSREECIKFEATTGLGKALGRIARHPAVGSALVIGAANRGKVGLGAGFILGRKLRKKKKTDQGPVPGDSPGSSSELSSKLDDIIFGNRRDWWNNPDAFGSAMDIAASETERERWLQVQRILNRPFRRVQPEDGDSLSATLDKLIEMGDPRPRNPLGEFAGNQQEGAADPNAMNIVYRQGQRKGLLEGGAAALAGGFLGATGGHAAKSTGNAIKALYGKLKGKK